MFNSKKNMKGSGRATIKECSLPHAAGRRVYTKVAQYMTMNSKATSSLLPEKGDHNATNNYFDGNSNKVKHKKTPKKMPQKV